MPLPYPLDLDDGREPIRCRDAHQASLLLGLWRAWNTGVASYLGLRDAPRDERNDTPMTPP